MPTGLNRILIVLLASAATWTVSADQGIRIDSRRTTTDMHKGRSSLALRELPRQSLIVAISSQHGVNCDDATVEPEGALRPGDLQIGIEQKLSINDSSIDLWLYGENGNEMDHSGLPIKPIAADFIDLNDYATRVDDLVRQKWLPLVTKRLPEAKQTLSRWDASAPAPAVIDDLLKTVDFQHAFLAAQAAHASIAESGESSARLGALIRAYAHLGDATRHLPNGQSAAFFSRAEIYALRLTRAAPDDPATWWHRAYLHAMWGLSATATADMKHADELAAKAPKQDPPAWLPRFRELLAFDTTALMEQTDATAPLAAYFAWLTVEHSPLQTMAINFARLAQAQNPGAVRAIHAMTNNSGVGLRHETTEQSTRALNRLIASLGNEPSAPKEVKDAVASAYQQRFSVPAIAKLLKDLDKQPVPRGQMLPWSTYVAIVRDCYFIDAVQRLTFVKYQWSVDVGDEVAQWMPLLSGHRYAPFIASFSDPSLVEKVRALPIQDDALGATPMARHFEALGIQCVQDLNVNWATRQSWQMDGTTYDQARLIWDYRQAGNLGDRNERLKAAKDLERQCSNNPVALATELMDNWPEMKDRASAIEEELGANPLIAYAVGSGYLSAGKTDDAIRNLKHAAKFAPDKEVYEQLARLQLERGDEAGWLASWQEYLDKSEDFGLEHATVRCAISRHFAAKRKYDRALPFAKDAADSYAGWALQEYADVLSGLGRYDEAEPVLVGSAIRYGNGLTLYWWCRATNHGHPDRARPSAQQTAEEYDHMNNPDAWRDASVFYALEGKTDHAAELIERGTPTTHDVMDLLLLAMYRMELKQNDQAERAIREAAGRTADNHGDIAYVACAKAIQSSLPDPKATPARDGDMAKVLNDPSFAVQRGNGCYLLGRFCELRGDSEAAKWWYAASMDTEAVNFTCRPLAAVALHRLGADYYK